ncbi:hypothetical protein [Amnibacterium kyonggiense]|uniref:hypothetical protein n=1 Tax=Amnibacterium kyonggiense TaxID=595671 RepID=UPI0013C2A068|nr:hypothetical protein [Amnibacterium kyonggiense]
MSSLQVGRCPTDGCDEPVTLGDLLDVEHGAPIWTCAGGHYGPKVVGASRDD